LTLLVPWVAIKWDTWILGVKSLLLFFFLNAIHCLASDAPNRLFNISNNFHSYLIKLWNSRSTTEYNLFTKQTRAEARPSQTSKTANSRTRIIISTGINLLISQVLKSKFLRNSQRPFVSPLLRPWGRI
jgi:hypothetical protein